MTRGKQITQSFFFEISDSVLKTPGTQNFIQHDRALKSTVIAVKRDHCNDWMKWNF